jgi:SAM-dependent methyltransferase
MKIASRAWSHERAFVGEHVATFIGEAREQNAGNEVHGGGYIYTGWYTLSWTRDHGAWQLAYLSWKPGGVVAKSAGWNEIFRNAVGFEHAPNRLLTDTVASLAPGRALDIAMGQGRNALYLAQRGWQVTGIDIADEGLQQARESAARAGLALDALHADVDAYDFGKDRWDLVTMIYAPAALARLRDIQDSVKPGGLVVYEYFAPVPGDDDAPAPGELAKRFAGWEIVRDDIVDGIPDWALDHAKLQRFVARK